MANTAPFRHGQIDWRRFPVESATKIERGDLLWADSDSHNNYVKPASDFTWDTDLATTQASFAAVFVGVAAGSSAVGETGEIDVDVSSLSVFEFDATADEYKPSDTLGPAANGSKLHNKILAKAVAVSAIGRVHSKTPAASTRVLTTLHSALALSNNVNANIG